MKWDGCREEGNRICRCICSRAAALSVMAMEGVRPIACTGVCVLIVCLLVSASSVYGEEVATGKQGSDTATDLVFAKVDRRIDLTSQIVRVTTVIRVENVGPAAVSEVVLAFPSEEAKSLAHLKVVSVEGKGKNRGPPVQLPVQVASVEGPANVTFYTVSLVKSLQKGESISIETYAAFTHVLLPFPVEIGQSDVQLVLYHGSATHMANYPTKVQTTTVKVPTPRIESFTKVEPSFTKTDSKTDGKAADVEIKYGSYENVNALSYSPITIHFENNKAFAVVKELQREIEISHWGNIYVTEKYHLMHAGAKHKGSFSRFDYQSKPSASGVSSFRNLLARLPPRAHSVYYRDEIGNISTSRLRSDYRKTELELEPRFPLFGGWQVTFTIGYVLPLKDFVFKSMDGHRYLNITFGTPFLDLVVDHLVVKVVLPEGSKQASASVPFPVKQSHEVKYTYLDTVGRPVVVLSKEHVVPEHNVPFEVHYWFSPLAMLAEPVLLVVAFFCFFLACITYTHFDLSISKSSAAYQARQQREEVMAAVQKVQKLINARAVISEKLEGSLRDLSRAGDVASCKAARKAADASLKDTSKELKAICSSLHSSARTSALLLKVVSREAFHGGSFPVGVLEKGCITRVECLIQKEKEKQDKMQQKHTATVEAYEKKLSSKEIDNRVAPYQQKLATLKQEVADLLSALDD